MVTSYIDVERTNHEAGNSNELIICISQSIFLTFVLVSLLAGLGHGSCLVGFCRVKNNLFPTFLSNFKCVRVKKVLLSTSSKHSMNYKQETTILKAYHRHHHLTIHNFPRRLTITGILISFRGFNVITVTISYQGNIYIFVGLHNFLVHFHSRKYKFFCWFYAISLLVSLYELQRVFFTTD
jgi:hypothetical protein